MGPEKFVSGAAQQRPTLGAHTIAAQPQRLAQSPHKFPCWHSGRL